MARTNDTEREWEQRSTPACDSCASLRARLESAEGAAREMLAAWDRQENLDTDDGAVEHAAYEMLQEAAERLRAALGAAGERSEG